MKILQNFKFFYCPAIFLAGSLAHAAPVYTGSICHGYDPEDVPYIQSYGHGVTNRSTTISRRVICPLTKTVPDVYGLAVKVYVDAPRGKVECVLRNYGVNGRQLGYQIAKNTLQGYGWISLRTAVSSVRSHYTVACFLPPNEDGELIAIEQVRN